MLVNWGWFKTNNSDEPIKGRVLDIVSYSVGAERFVVMENIITPVNQKRGLLEEIKKCFEVNSELEKKIVFCGGIASCNGFEDRIKRDHYFDKVSIVVDEHFMWKEAVCIIK